MRTTLFTILAGMALALASCAGSSDKSSGMTADSTDVVSVDVVMANPDAYLDNEITIDGVCHHLCKFGGRKAFIVGSDDKVMLRCEAGEEMGGAFSQDCLSKPLKVTGILREDRIDEEAVVAMEKQYAAHLQALDEGQFVSLEDAEDAAGGCATDKAAQGQADIATVEARMADYRAKIAERKEKEGKDYLSYYHLDATAYEIQPE